MFFSKFQKINYNGRITPNITQSVLLKYKTMYNSTLWKYHKITDGETPQSIAYQYYKNAGDYWVILLVNNIVNPYFDWVLSSQELTSFCEEKYGYNNIDKIHHLINVTTGKWLNDVDLDFYVKDGYLTRVLPSHIMIVSNLEYETSENDRRRDIKILNPTYLTEFKNQFEDTLKGIGP